MLLILFCLQFQQHQPSYVILFSRNRKPRSIMTNIATLLETAIAHALPDNWQQEPETHLPALSLIISNILLPNCCQMSNLNSLAALIEESAVLKQLPAAYKNKLAHTVYDTLARFNGLG